MILAHFRDNFAAASKPRPIVAVEDVLDRASTNAKLGRKLVLRHGIAKAANFQDISLTEPRARNALSAQLSAVDCPIRGIFEAGLPRQMALRAAGFVAFPAGVCRFVLGGRRRTFDVFTDAPRDDIPIVATADKPVAIRVRHKRPSETVVPFISEHNVKIIRLRSASTGGATQRVSVPTPAIVMRSAKSVGIGWRLAAIVYRAYSIVSHFSLSKGWPGQNPSQRSNARRVRFLYRRIVGQTSVVLP